MKSRAGRVTVMVLLIVITLAAGAFLWILERRTNDLLASRADAATRVARMTDALIGIGTAQQSYVAPGQLDEPWFERADSLITQLSGDIDLAAGRMRSAGAADTLQSLAASHEALVTSDARTRENLGLGQDLMASDVIFSDGRNLLDGMLAALRNLQTAEDDHYRAGLETIGRQRTMAFAGAAVVWLIALLVLSRVPKAVAAPVTQRTEQPVVPSEAEQAKYQPAQASERGTAPPVERTAEQRPTIDLLAAAAVCTDLSRVTTTAALPDLLARAARTIDASGLILWVSAGEQLFPVMAHGYSDDMLARLAPVHRDADNAAAEAWRSGRLTAVAAAAGAPGAIVAPLFGLHACVGVLSAEVRNGTEHDKAVQAVLTVLCAQLATVIPAWPAGAMPQQPAAESSQVRSA